MNSIDSFNSFDSSEHGSSGFRAVAIWCRIKALSNQEIGEKLAKMKITIAFVRR